MELKINTNCSSTSSSHTFSSPFHSLLLFLCAFSTLVLLHYNSSTSLSPINISTETEPVRKQSRRRWLELRQKRDSAYTAFLQSPDLQCWRNMSSSMKYLKTFICSAMVKRATEGLHDVMPSPRRPLWLAGIRVCHHVTSPSASPNSQEKLDTLFTFVNVSIIFT